MAQPVAPLAVPAPVAPFLGNGQQEQPASVFVPQDEVSPEQLNQQRLKADMERRHRTFWEDSSTALLGSLDDSVVREVLGFSAEQKQQYEQYVFNALEGTLLVQKVEIQNEEGKTAWTNAITISSEEENLAMTNAMTGALNNVLTPEQQRIIREAQLANMGDMSIISPSMFEALDLTDAQREEMAKIKENLKWEFEEHLNNIVDCEMILSTKMTNELHRLMGKEIVGDVNEALNEAKRLTPTILKSMEKDPEFNQKQMEMMSKGKEFSTNFKQQMFDVLSDEQWKRLQRLIDNPPEHAKIFRKKLKEQNGESEAVATEKPEKEVWQPGPNSWKPGDAIPEKYRIERNERGKFPRVEEK